MASAPLFCPFCRECFEGEARCPEHELPLVAFDRLPKQRSAAPRDDEPVALHELRYGRWSLLLAALLLVVGMALPFVHSGQGEPQVSASAYELAADRALNLWILLAVAFTLLSIFTRRRTPVAMRGSRVAILVLAVLALSSIGYTLWRVRRASAAMDVAFAIGVGAYVLCLAVALTAVGGIVLGAANNKT